MTESTLVNSCIRVVGQTIGVRGRRKVCAATPQEEGRHAVSKIRRTEGMKIAIKDSKRYVFPAVRKTVSQRTGVDETKSF
ncbi:hypothetical protein E2C01_034443 [Portunus trituberculatus]|uniref:Uncharacterized protein n=1 Tax=Portunus trituberculatus TaxID=210409 RepID=A0A5B7F0M9_PORTR|nr:hypothetical protein [Portunus trituberculatus]